MDNNEEECCHRNDLENVKQFQTLIFGLGFNRQKTTLMVTTQSAYSVR